MNAPPVRGRIRGLHLRRLLIDMLASAHGPLTVPDMVRRCEEIGVPWGRGRPSKIVSDALRWEVDRGRVARTGRSTYRFAGAPRTTLWRIRREAARIRDGLASVPSSGDLHSSPHGRPTSTATG